MVWMCDRCTKLTCAVLLQAPKDPVTGKALTPVSDPNKDGYQATQQIPQGRNASARVLDQLEAQPQGRSFGGKDMLTWLVLHTQPLPVRWRFIAPRLVDLSD
eukprot:GHUV01049246.1.p3 GENE.GHUV01049246.1~~GHUV01049246.1.p3  ORF type:complete len:102 (-),score=20.70 GHUV01049246.1:434-739(-)